MTENHPYLNPPCRPSTLDSFGNRRLILRALKQQLSRFEGDVLDVGCGHKPYRDLLLSPPSRATSYVGLDLPDNIYSPPDVVWDGTRIPLPSGTVSSVLATEVLEHCPNPQVVLDEMARAMKPGGFFFMTVPFLWPLHTVPHDEFRYTPFSLERMLIQAGFSGIQIRATGGWNAALGILLGLWIRRRPLTSRVHIVRRAIYSRLFLPIVWGLLKSDRPPERFEESTMIVGLSATATRANP